MAAADSSRVHQYATGGGIVIHQGQMLLLQRPTRQEIRLPKGHIDPGETPDVTALRETAEESGYWDLAIIAELGSQLVEFDRAGLHYQRTEHYYLMALRSEDQIERPAEDQAQFQVMWLPLDEAIAALTYVAEKTMARKAVEAYARQTPL